MDKCTIASGDSVERYLLNLLTDEEETAFQQHLLTCDTCAAKVQRIRALTQELLAEEQVDEYNRAPMRWKGGRLMYLLVASVLVLLTSGAYFLYLRSTAEPNGSGTQLVRMDSSMRTIGPNSLPPSASVLPTAKDTAKELPKDKKPKGKPRELTPEMEPAPIYASVDSLRVQWNIRMIAPETPILQRAATDTTAYVFQWECNGATPSMMLHINAQGLLIDEYRMATSKEIKVDLHKYASYGTIEWVLNSVDRRVSKKGWVVFE